ncbi:MAG: ABC transporter permease [Treponema sp.]|jgi:peptide/nickel transport system permease protein|nr:ABC transporter permease [Treponema sp.]
MIKYIIKRVFYMIPTLIGISILSFFIIQLPPGDYLTTKLAGMMEQGQTIDIGTIELLEARYGLDKPIIVQYWKWISGILSRGDFGESFEWNRPVTQMIWGRLGLTFILSFSTLIFIWLIAFPVGIYSAVKKYSLGDYVFTFLGFIGLAIPNFLFALTLMYIAFSKFGLSVGGLFSPRFQEAPWSLAKLVDLLQHIWIPMVVLGLAGTANLIRTMRANLMDELKKPYVVTARAKGLTESRLLIKYPVRVALNPFISTVGWILPNLVSGSTVVSIVLNLPTTGPLLLRSLQSQDMYLAGSFILLLSTLTVIGTLLSDILLAAVDPRIRFS